MVKQRLFHFDQLKVNKEIVISFRDIYKLKSLSSFSELTRPLLREISDIKLATLPIARCFYNLSYFNYITSRTHLENIVHKF